MSENTPAPDGRESGLAEECHQLIAGGLNTTDKEWADWAKKNQTAILTALAAKPDQPAVDADDLANRIFETINDVEELAVHDPRDLLPIMKEVGEHLSLRLRAENEQLWEALEEWRFRHFWKVDGMRTEQARIHAKAFIIEARIEVALKAALQETGDGTERD